MSKSNGAARLLVALVAILGLQFAVALSWSEPFPAIIMPGFGGRPPSSGRTDIRAYRVVATGPSGSEFAVSAPEFFTGLPHWYLMTDLPFVLDSTPADMAWRHVRGRLAHRAKLRSEAGLPSFAVYAQRRLAQLTGRSDWHVLRIEETRRDFDIDQMSYVGSARVDRSREFNLR